MKKIIFMLCLFYGCRSHAQSYEVERLILDIQKLAQLKSILTDLYKGYEILNSGYGAIKNISEGNFNLHQTFLNSLLLVNPAVKNYVHVAGIISSEASIVSEYKSAFTLFKQAKHFNPDELVYMSTVYNKLVNASFANLQNLLNILTANTLRMSDDERLHAIDEIYIDMNDKLAFLRQFINSAKVLAVQRASDTNDAETLRRVYGLN